MLGLGILCKEKKFQAFFKNLCQILSDLDQFEFTAYFSLQKQQEMSLTTKEIDTMIDKYKSTVQEIHLCMSSSIEVAQALEEQDESQKVYLIFNNEYTSFTLLMQWRQVQDMENTIKEYIDLEESINQHTTVLYTMKRHLNSVCFTY